MDEAKAVTPCGIRVGDEVRYVPLPLFIMPCCTLGSFMTSAVMLGREWREGTCLLFDDSYEHETWNTTDEERVILLVGECG